MIKLRPQKNVSGLQLWLCEPLVKRVRNFLFQHHSSQFKSLSPRQNGRHYTDDIFKCIFLNENIWISSNISLKFVPEWQINKIPALVQIMAWRRPGTKPLSEPMMFRLLTHICITRPQWVNKLSLLVMWIPQMITAIWSHLLVHPSLWDLSGFISFGVWRRSIYNPSGDSLSWCSSSYKLVFCVFRLHWARYMPMREFVTYVTPSLFDLNRTCYGLRHW